MQNSRRAFSIGRLSAWIAVTGLLSGACTTGRPFPTAAVSNIEKGVWTKEDVRRALGEPISITTMPSPEAYMSPQDKEESQATIQHLPTEMWMYQRITVWPLLSPFIIPAEHDLLTVMFDKNGVAVDYSLSQAR